MAANRPETIVYVSNAGSKEIHVFAMDRASGALDLVEKVPVPGTEVPSPSSMPMALSPDRRFLYAALRSPPYPVSSFAIDPASGRLSHLGHAPLADSMAYLVTDRSGRFLLAASYPGAKLAVNPIDAAGRVGDEPVQVLATPPKAHCVVIDAANRHVYCPALGADSILQLKFDAATGTLSPNTPGEIRTKPGAGPRHLVFHPSGHFLYLITETTATVGAYAIDAERGTLHELHFLDMLAPDHSGPIAAADLHVTPDGRFLYGSERRTSTLAGFTIDPQSGRLGAIGRFPTEKTPRGFRIDPRGRFLLAAGLDSHAMTVYAIDAASGALDPRHQYPMGQMPNWIEIVDLR